MVFPWTTVDTVLDKFNQAVADLDQLAEDAEADAENARERSAYWIARAGAYDYIKERAQRISGKINDLIS